MAMDKRPVFSRTKDQGRSPSLERMLVPIISIDRLSQDIKDLPIDDILAIGDQALLRQIAPDHWAKFRLERFIKDRELFGPLVDDLYETLNRLENRMRGSCEVLLYLSGHGIDPGNIGLVPNSIKPHPARVDLRIEEPDQWYTHEAEQYLDEFYRHCANSHVISAYRGPLGFVGGEVYAHQRGFIGVLGVLGLWCHAHRNHSPDDTVNHLVVVADCCFAGIWGSTLESIAKSEAPDLQKYRELLYIHPVSIQCATSEFEASHSGVFTPLWYFLNNASGEDLDNYLQAFLKEGEPVSGDEFDTQHPFYVSTSIWSPSWKCFDDPDLFMHLHSEQLKELEADLGKEDNRKALDVSCTPRDPEREVDFNEVEKGFEHFSPLARPRVTALASAALNLRDILQEKTREKQIFDGPYSTPELSLSLQTVRESICTIEQYLENLSKLLFMAAPRFRPEGYVLKKKDKLSIATDSKLRDLLQPRDEERPIPPGVYVFQGGEGDMSLIVTPRQVILIDGTKTADCFKAAWDSTLKYLPQITHIFVTHHDEEHTFGIQLLLARYCVEQTESLPDISRTIIYMNTHAGLIPRNVFQEEIERLAEMVPCRVQQLIIQDEPLRLAEQENFFIVALLPKQSLVDEVNREVRMASDGDGARPVPSRGGTTAAKVLSINLVAVWRNRDAYLFTGDAHLKDVTQAAQDFLALDDHGMKSFKYVDVPHHGSARSNVENVDDEDRGLAGVPAKQYLISHCGDHQNPSFQTVADIIQSDKCNELHFLYPQRRQALSCNTCEERDTKNWHCRCVTAKQAQDKIDKTLHGNERFKFFPFN